MINFQRVVNVYKEAKRKAAKDIKDRFTWTKEEDFSLVFFEHYSTYLSRFIHNMEKDLGEEISLLRKSKEKLRCAKQYLREKDITVAMKMLCEAEKYFLEFKEKELEEKLTSILKQHLKKIEL